jgi:hypothetical protein
MGGRPIQPIDRTRTETPGLEGLLGREEGAEHRPGGIPDISEELQTLWSQQ